jgi:uncharacterized repeat protein (TIGR01451 family)
MKPTQLIFCLVLLYAAAPAYAQISAPVCPGGAIEPAYSLPNICIRCNFSGYSGDNFAAGIPGTLTSCPSTEITNPSYFGFMATSSTAQFVISNQQCGNGDGLQMFLFDDLSEPPLACEIGQAGGAPNTLTMQYNQLVPGKNYLLVIDGFAGDFCSYELEVTGQSGATGTLPAPGPVSGPNQICPGGSANFSVPPAGANIAYFTWTSPPGSLINGQGNMLTLPAASGNSVEIIFGQVGGQVKVSSGNTCAGNSPISGKIVNVVPIPPTNLPPITISAADLPYSCLGGNMINNIGTFTCTDYFTSYLGCDSLVVQKVIVTNLPPGTVRGKIFRDLNNDGIQNAGEPLYTSGAVVYTSGGAITTSTIAGEYTLTGVALGDTIRVQLPADATDVNPDFRIYTQNSNWLQYHFGLYKTLPPGFVDVSIDIVNSTPFRPGFPTKLYVTCRNLTTSPLNNAVVKVVIPAFSQFLTSTPAGQLVADTITWDLGALAANTQLVLTINLLTPANIPLNTSVHIAAEIGPYNNDIFPANNFDDIATVVVGSYDPNDKQVDPPYVTPGILNNGSPFEYTVRFQNTGNYPAEFVRIIDTLSALLNPSTFQFVSSSHPCTWKVYGNGIVEFFFDQIWLPDSLSDEPGSHGFVRFTLRPDQGLPLGTIVPNFADIYFDFNTPIRTNTAGTQVVYFIPGTGITTDPGLLLKPNPAAFHVFCSWKRPAPAEGFLRLYNMYGLLQASFPVPEGSVHEGISLAGIPAGQYFVVLNAGDLYLAKKLVVVQPDPLGN